MSAATLQRSVPLMDRGAVRIHKGQLSVKLPLGYKLGGGVFIDALSGRCTWLGPDIAPFAGADRPFRCLTPKRSARQAPGFHGQREDREPLEGVDPSVIGFDGMLYQGTGSVQYQTSGLTYAASASANLQLPRNTFITEIMLVADPFDTQGDGTNTATIVEDAMDKLLQGLAIAGGPTYYSHSDAILFGKALGNLNKQVYGGSILRQNISTSSSTATASATEAWRLHFGALNDYNPFDITAGIPAEDETALNLSILFPSTSLLAATAAHKVLQTTTIVRVVVVGVNGMPAGYRANCPIPDFKVDLITAPTSQSTFNLQGSRFLKRTTIVNQAASASNNNARNDSNLTDISIVLLKPTTIKLMDRARILTGRAMLTSWGGRYPGVEANGLIAVDGLANIGVIVIDWRKITGNPYGLDLYNFQTGDGQLVFTVGTTTGQLSAYQEYYAARNLESLAAMRAWQGKFAYQAV